MAELTIQEALDNIYGSLKADNADLEQHITALKQAMAREGQKEVVVEPSRLAQNNRQGRKLMQAYFRQRGVKIDFAKD